MNTIGKHGCAGAKTHPEHECVLNSHILLGCPGGVTDFLCQTEDAPEFMSYRYCDHMTSAPDSTTKKGYFQ